MLIRIVSAKKSKFFQVGFSDRLKESNPFGGKNASSTKEILIRYGGTNSIWDFDLELFRDKPKN